MNISRRTFAEVLGVGATGLLFAPGSAAAADSDRLTFADGYNVTTLNPVLSAQTSVGLLLQLTMAYLVRYDHRNEPIPELAEAVPTRANGGVSADGKRITWRLRRDAKWSDGAPFTADDVAFSVAVMQSPANNVVSHDGFALIERVETPDRYTAVFHLTETRSRSASGRFVIQHGIATTRSRWKRTRSTFAERPSCVTSYTKSSRTTIPQCSNFRPANSTSSSTSSRAISGTSTR